MSRVRHDRAQRPRVLLFVENDSGRIVYRCVATRLAGNVWRHELARSGLYVWHWHKDAAVHAPRWWLVECENADAGRRLIDFSHSVPRDFHALPTTLLDGTKGRILAHGSREPREAAKP